MTQSNLLRLLAGIQIASGIIGCLFISFQIIQSDFVFNKISLGIILSNLVLFTLYIISGVNLWKLNVLGKKLTLILLVLQFFSFSYNRFYYLNIVPTNIGITLKEDVIQYVFNIFQFDIGIGISGEPNDLFIINFVPIALFIILNKAFSKDL